MPKIPEKRITMRRLLIFIFIAVSGTTQLSAQQFGNEWIVYSQQYFTIPVHQRGIYRIDYNTMLNAGVPLGSFDPRSFQVFARGQEQPIFVKNESSGVFQPGDYIEFYGDRNDGWLDQAFYTDPSKQPNPNYSLINDTITYYITWNSSLNNRRFAIQESNNFAGYNAANWFWFTSREDYTSHYYEGETNNYGVTEPEYTEAEGWFDAPITLGQSRTKIMPTPNIFTAGPQATIEMAVAGASNYRPLNPDHHLQIQFAGQLIDLVYEGYALLRFNRMVQANSLNAAGTPFVFSSVNSLGSPVDRSAITYISVRYPHNFNMRDQSSMFMELPPSTGDRTLVSFTAFNAIAADTVYIYNLTNNARIRVFNEGGTYRALVGNPTQTRRLFLTQTTNTIRVNRIRPVSSNPASFARFTNFLSQPHVNSDYLIISHRSLINQAEQFRQFRNLTGYKVLLVDVDELYHQFAYGIAKHPLSIRNFAAFALARFDTKPTKLFLIGKTRGALAYRKNPSIYAASLVPSLGNPPSDILLTAGLDGFGYAPALGTGRLAARNPAQVTLYFNKVVQHHDAQQTPQEWMKNVLHFGGGTSISEQNVLSGYLRGYKRSMENPSFGGYVRTFLKSSTDPIQINQSDSLKQIINNGVSFMTFFGHAAGIGFDISIDYPSEYSNFGKYPFLIANSCFAGDIFGAGINSSEEFVLIEEKGVIGYLASTTATGAFEINRYSNFFFENVGSEMYGMPVGDIMRQTVRLAQSSNVYIKNVCLLNTLHGDPAVVINSFPKPDYKLETRNLYFSPKDVSSEMDSFSINIIATNIGKAIRDSMFIDIERRFPDGTTEIFKRRVRTPFFKDTLSFHFPVDRQKGVGINQFTVTLDALNQINELNELNNRATASLFIKSSEIIPVYPPKYAIVPNSAIQLKASTGDPFVGERTYVFQLDTTPRFTSPLEHRETQKGGVVAWTPPVTLMDGMVYYWRVSLVSANPEEFFWRESSFQHLKGLTGWSQARFDQFENNHYTFVTHNKSERIWEFINSVNSLQAQTGVYPYLAWSEQFVKLNGVILTQFACMSEAGNGMLFSLFNPVSGAPVYSVNQGNNLGQYENFHCNIREVPVFEFYSTSELWRERMKKFIDIIPDDYYVLVLSHRNHNAENYPEGLYRAFESLGSANIRNLVNNSPYILFGRKGSPLGSANEILGSSITSTILLNDSIVTNWNRGYILSEPIGPSSKWQTINWQHRSLEKASTDSVWLNIIGITASGVSDTIATRIPSIQSTLDIRNVIDARKYPYLRLMVNMFDDENRTPGQMDYWNVIFEGIPETAINPSLHYVFEKDSVPEGKDILFSTAIQNISNYDMDSLLVRYWITDRNRAIHPIEYPRQRKHPSGHIFADTVFIKTRGLAGNNNLWIEVNPAGDQLEQYSFNNIGQVPFFVAKDITNPLLEVTFDGIQIMNGDLVSANPFINITIRDENRYLALTDTALIKVFLTTPASSESQRLYFVREGKENMKFFPAQLPANQCSIEFEPKFELDGKYTLRVQATDMSLNESGANDYVISFEVLNQSTITEVLNWPNPFTTATHFVFTLTGSRLPSQMKIQILTITGKVVREIDMSELGPLRIGRNITQYAWDGTDQYGDRLANGVYLYRVVTQIDGSQIELNTTSASRFFHNGFGKMYLMR